MTSKNLSLRAELERDEVHAKLRTSATLRYLELKSGYADSGPAWIGRVKVSRSGRTVYFNGKAFRRAKGIRGNHFDLLSGEEYWISGVKKDGQDRHWAGGGRITIEADAVEAYLRIVGRKTLDPTKFIVSRDIKPADPAAFLAVENAKPK